MMLIAAAAAGGARAGAETAPATVAPAAVGAAADRGALEALALARARTELVRQVLALPLDRATTVRQWAGRSAARDRALRAWLRSTPPHGASRVYSSGLLELDLRLAGDRLALKLIALSRDAGAAGAAGLTFAELAPALARWGTVWATGSAAPGEVTGDAPAGWADVAPGGVELARQAAIADALHGLLDDARELRVSAAMRVREFLASDPAVEQAVYEGLGAQATVEVELAVDQVAQARARIGPAELVRVLSESCASTYTGERFRPGDFRELLLMPERAELSATGVAIPPDAFRTSCPADVIGVDAPGWAEKSLQVTGRFASGEEALFPLELCAALAGCAAADALREQAGRLALMDGRAVEVWLAERPAAWQDFELVLTGARVVRVAHGWPVTEVQLELPLRALWRIISRAGAASQR